MSERLTFDGRVAIVTGAGRGLGRQHALSLASRGAHVVVNDVGLADDGERSAAQAVVDEIVAGGGVAVGSIESVGTAEGGMAIVAAAVDAFGRIDILVNNAGILRDRTFANLSPAEITDVLDVHLLGAFWVTQPAFRIMREHGYGRIVMTTSAAGLFGGFGQANYSAAKMGLVGLARSLAQEGRKYGVRVNVFAPVARTRMTDELLGVVGEQLDPSLASPMAVWLCHEDCPVSGEVLSSFGGRMARVFVAVSEGVVQDDVTVESVRDAFDDILEPGAFSVPRKPTDELKLLLDARKAATASAE